MPDGGLNRIGTNWDKLERVYSDVQDELISDEWRVGNFNIHQEVTSSSDSGEIHEEVSDDETSSSTAGEIAGDHVGRIPDSVGRW